MAIYFTLDVKKYNKELECFLLYIYQLHIMNASEINDIRQQVAFKGISFSKYKKTDVKNEFVTNLLNGKIEPACNWAAELVCAGHFLEL